MSKGWFGSLSETGAKGLQCLESRECKGDVGKSESSAPDVRIRSDSYAKEGMTQIYLNDQLKIVFFFLIERWC